MISADKIRTIAGEKIADSGLFLVDVTVKPGNKITVLLDADKGVAISDCVEMSRYIESQLDRDTEDFELSVMSAGLTEPFKILRQYQKNIGRHVDVLTTENTKLSGKLLSADENGIVLETKATERGEAKKGKQTVIHNIPLTFSQIKKTTVVLSF